MLELGADMDKKRPPSLITIRERGSKHPQEEVRALFSDCQSNLLRDDIKRDPEFLQISRTWMPSFLLETGSGLKTRTKVDTVRHLDLFDISSFPKLHDERQLSLGTTSQIANGAWPLERAGGFAASLSAMSTVPERRNPEVVQPEIDELPHLDKGFRPLASNAQAVEYWANPTAARGQSSHSRPSASSENTESRQPLKGTKGGKLRYRTEWRAFQL